MAKLGVGVVGVGRMGTRHAENISRLVPQARLVAVADPNLAAARAVAQELGINHHYDSAAALVEDKEVQAVVLASPPKFHAADIQAAAAAGKHILCEKPLTLTLEESDRVLAAVAKAGVVLQVGFMRRYDPAYAAARRRIEAGEIGDPVIFNSIGRDREPPPPSFFKSGFSGTLFLDSTIHEFDLGRWMMKDEVVEVHAFAGTLACPELAQWGDMDAGVVNLRFARGALGSVQSFRQSRYGYDISTEVVGTKGTLRVGYLRQTALTVLSGEGVGHDVVDHFLTRFAEAYLQEVRDFVATVHNGSAPRISGEEGRKALAIAIAANLSFREARVVRV